MKQSMHHCWENTHAHLMSNVMNEGHYTIWYIISRTYILHIYNGYNRKLDETARFPFAPGGPSRLRWSSISSVRYITDLSGNFLTSSRCQCGRAKGESKHGHSGCQHGYNDEYLQYSCNKDFCFLFLNVVWVSTSYGGQFSSLQWQCCG